MCSIDAMKYFVKSKKNEGCFPPFLIFIFCIAIVENWENYWAIGIITPNNLKIIKKKIAID